MSDLTIMQAQLPATVVPALQSFKQELETLKEGNARLVFDYRDPEGNKAARSHLFKIRRSKALINDTRLAETKASREYQKQVNDQAGAILDELEEMIRPHADALAAVEAEEEARKAALDVRIIQLQLASVVTISQTAEEIRSVLEATEALDPATFEERIEEAALIRSAAITALQSHLQAAIKREADAKRLAELEEADRVRREADAAAQAEVDRKAQEEADRLAEAQRMAEAEARALRDAEQAARAVEEQKRRDQVAADLLAEREARVKAEAEAKVLQDAEMERRRVIADEERRAANKRHKAKIHGEIVAGLQKVAEQLSVEAAQAIIIAIAKGEVPNLTISY